MYAVQVMRGVIEEKTNRIVEIIISSVSTFELMMAKIIGIGLVGIHNSSYGQLLLYNVINYLPQIIPDKYNPASQLKLIKY